MKRCELCGKISWGDRTVVSVLDTKPIKIVIKGKEYTEVKLCKKCTDALIKMVIYARGEE